MKAYKGFNKDLTCRDFKYEEGGEYETEKAECCEAGFHACEYPLDVFGYYSPNRSVFHEVEVSGTVDKSNNGDKICGTKIKIGARLDISGMVKAAIDFTMSRIKPEADSSEDYGASSATGDYGASSATGTCGASSATGYKGASIAKDSTAVAVAWGHEARAKGCRGAHLILSDWRYIGETYSDGEYKDPFNKDSWELKGAKLLVVDGENVKEDTYYRCINGEIVEVDDTNNPVEKK